MRFLRPTLIALGAAVALALLHAWVDLALRPGNTLAWTFPRYLAVWATEAILVPVVVLAARQFRFGHIPAYWAILIHAAMALLFAAAHYALLTWTHHAFFVGGPFWSTFRELFLSYVQFDVITYGLIVGTVHAWLSHEESRERALAEQTLRADLGEARLRTLRAQLHPHFLFNSMNAISMLVRAGRSDEAVSTLTRLSELLRRVLRDNARHEVPLRDELEFARQYLAIERVRFGERLDVAIDAPDDTLDVLVPDLILQPLVENAMRHAVSRSNRPALVRITASRAHGMLDLTVGDNGPGLPDGWSLERSGVGLRNSAARLAQLYGTAARLHVGANDLGGVTARVTLPASLHTEGPSLHVVHG